MQALFHHCLCLHLLFSAIAGPVLTGLGIALLVKSRQDPQGKQRDQLNSDAEVWQKEPVYGYVGFSGLAASARLSIVQGDASGVCPAAATALAPYVVGLQGSADPADVIPEQPSNLESWQQWKFTTSWPAPPANATYKSIAYQPGCALKAVFFNGPDNGSGSIIASVQAGITNTVTYTPSALQCSTTSSNTCSSSSGSPAAYSAGAAMTTNVSVAGTVSTSAVVRHTSGTSSSCKPSCASACSAQFGTWDSATRVCTVQTGLHALCARGSPINDANSQIYRENNTFPDSTNTAGCYIGANGFQPSQDVYLTDGSTTGGPVLIVLRSSQDPYLDYLALTGGKSFSLAASYYRTVGAILLAIGLVLLLGSVAMLCCCCCLIRRVSRLNNGQPLGWLSTTIYNTAQAYRIPLQYICMQAPGQPQQQAPMGYAPSAPYEQESSSPGHGNAQQGSYGYGQGQYPTNQDMYCQPPEYMTQPPSWQQQQQQQHVSGMYASGQDPYARQQGYRPQNSAYSQSQQYPSVQMSEQQAVGYPSVYPGQFPGGLSAGPQHGANSDQMYNQPKI